MGQAAVADQLQACWQELAVYLRRRVGDPALAADLAQEAFLRLAALPENAIIANPRGYLFTVAQRLVADHWRSSATRYERTANEETLHSAVDPTPRPDETLIQREAVSILSATIEALPPRTREVFRLHKFENLSYIEIGQRLGIARNTVMVHITLALGRCRDALCDYRSGATNASRGPVRL
ncbi:RNA polymerase sigma factor [Steroidobacter flavus]|uniref:RNA polymerase sigma factor n=1 Tax=Steroidobacter flavus TaxID=1842136 RepID=A0ABV8SU61_9GAMM